MSERIHDPVTREYVPGGFRFTCQQCGAQVSVPDVLVAQWERERRLYDEIEPRLTRTLLLRTHNGRQIHTNDPLWSVTRGRQVETLADETANKHESVIATAQTRLARSQETFPDDWRTRFTFYDGDVADVLAVVASLRDMVRDALATDGAHHKQWYLQQIALSLGIDGNDWSEGIAP